MPEIKEITNEVKKKLKKIDKKKVFGLAVVGVSAIALFSLWKRKNAESEIQTAYVAAGYDGYPSGGISGQDGETAYSNELNEMDEYYNAIFEEQGKKYESYIEGITSGYEKTLSDYDLELNARDTALAEVQKNAERQTLIAEMQRNSDLYWYTSGAERQRLVDRNEEIGAQLGVTKSEGVWYDASGSRLFMNAHEAAGQNLAKSNVTYDKNVDYQAKTNELFSSGAKGNSASVSDTVIKRASKISGEKMTNESVTYDKRVDYQAAINKAKADGASDSVIKTLEAQRAAKIKGENLNQDGSKKK